MNARLQFISILFAAIAVSFVPIIHWPFSWLETYFHELSHGLLAILSGGRIQYIELHFRGSGLCVTSGGWQAAVAFAGYFGAVFWGVAIYKTVSAAHAKVSSLFTGMLLVTLLLTALLWARDLETLVIMSILFFLFLAITKYGNKSVVKVALQFSGLYVLTNAARSPLVLLDGQSIGDGATLATLTWIPEIVWVAIWTFVSMIGLWVVWPKKMKRS